MAVHLGRHLRSINDQLGWHLDDGQSFTVNVASRSFEAAAFGPADPDLGGRQVLDLAWSYPDPLPEVARIKDHVCFYFYAERTDLRVDGVEVPRPRTMWSPPAEDAAAGTGEPDA